MATVVSLAAALEFRDEEHPLQWLQPTPEITAPSALCLPLAWRPSWRPSAMDQEALSDTSQSSRGVSCERMSDASTSISEIGEAPTEACIAGPPLLTPSLPSKCSTPPPPMRYPLEMPPSPFAWQTPSPIYASAVYRSFRPLVLNMQEADQFAHGLAPALQEAADSFTALGAWSEMQEGTVGYLDDGRPQDAEKIADFMQPARQQQNALVSVGSAQHELGKCKPCAFVHRPVGCTDGVNCTFCHLCEPGERKRRQKEKLQCVQQRRLRRVGTSTSLQEEIPDGSSTPVAQQVGLVMPR